MIWHTVPSTTSWEIKFFRRWQLALRWKNLVLASLSWSHKMRERCWAIVRSREDRTSSFRFKSHLRDCSSSDKGLQIHRHIQPRNDLRHDRNLNLDITNQLVTRAAQPPGADPQFGDHPFKGLKIGATEFHASATICRKPSALIQCTSKWKRLPERRSASSSRRSGAWSDSSVLNAEI